MLLAENERNASFHEPDDLGIGVARHRPPLEVGRLGPPAGHAAVDRNEKGAYRNRTGVNGFAGGFVGGGIGLFKRFARRVPQCVPPSSN